MWQASDIVNGALPTLLQGVSVTVNGLPAYVDYISPTQINALAPDDATLGPVPVQVTTAGADQQRRDRAKEPVCAGVPRPLTALTWPRSTRTTA